MALPLHYQHEKEKEGPQVRIGLDHYTIALCTFDRSLRKLMHTFKRHVLGIKLYLSLITPPFTYPICTPPHLLSIGQGRHSSATSARWTSTLSDWWLH